MREHLGFLKASSAVVKIAAWFFLCLGILGSMSLFLGRVSGSPRWMGVIVLGVYAFMFFLLFLIARIVDLLVKIIDELKKEVI